jgi:hypothetical protein
MSGAAQVFRSSVMLEVDQKFTLGTAARNFRSPAYCAVHDWPFSIDAAGDATDCDVRYGGAQDAPPNGGHGREAEQAKLAET